METAVDRMHQPLRLRLVGRRRGDLVFIDPDDAWAFEAAGRLTFVHCASGRFDLDLSLRELEAWFSSGIVRPHRNWLVFRRHVRALIRDEEGILLAVGAIECEGGRGIRVPIARGHLRPVRDALLAGAVGLRRSCREPAPNGDRTVQSLAAARATTADERLPAALEQVAARPAYRG